MNDNNDLFNRSQALQTFGNETILKTVLQEFLQEVDPMIERLRQALSFGDQAEVRRAVHWFRGGLAYLFSPAAERACALLDEATAQEETSKEAGRLLTDLESVLHRVRDHCLL